MNKEIGAFSSWSDEQVNEKINYCTPSHDLHVDNDFVKHDSGKPRMGLIPPEALTELAKVLTFGAKKYNAHNWRKGAEWSRYYDAALRHLNAWNAGQDLDSETGLNHLAHALACLCFILSSQISKLGTDDRFTSQR